MENTFELKQFEPAIEKVRSFADATGREFGILAWANGKTVFEKAGTEGSVDFEEARDLFHPGQWLIHSHPVPSALSFEDIQATGANDLAGVVATTPNGGIYAAKNIDTSSPWTFLAAQSNERFVVQLANGLFRYAGFSVREADFIGSHVMNLRNQIDKVYDYYYKFSPAEALAWEKFEELRRKHGAA